MEKEVVNLKLPLVKVTDADPWHGTEYKRENFPTGCFIIDDGYNYHFAWHDGNGYCSEMGLNRDNVLEAIVEDARFDEFKKGFDIIEEIENRLQQIARLAGECKDEVVTRTTVIEDKIDDLGRSGGGDGVNVLDLAKSFAVIQKPELIKELGK